jgi:hypothetical protein
MLFEDLHGSQVLLLDHRKILSEERMFYPKSQKMRALGLSTEQSRFRM